MTCRRCGSENVITQAVSEQKRRGFFASILWVLFAICTFGIIVLIPIIMKKGSKTRTYAVCQDCGKRWKVR